MSSRHWLRLRRKRGLIGWLLGSREIKMIPAHAVTYSKYWAYQMILMFFSGCFFTICYVATVFVHVGGQVNEWGSGVEARETAFGWVVAVTADASASASSGLAARTRSAWRRRRRSGGA